MLMRSLSLACMIWLFAETQQEMRLLASDWLATPGLKQCLKVVLHGCRQKCPCYLHLVVCQTQILQNLS